MNSETMRNNTTELEEILAMALGLPDAGSSIENAINPDLNVLVLGDSLFGNEIGKVFLNGLGCKIENWAVSGASFSSISEKQKADGSFNNIESQLKRFQAAVKNETDNGIASGEGDLAFHVPDAILIDGGGNDYIYAARMGKLNDLPSHYKLSTYDASTVMGGLERVLHYLDYYPKAQKFFLMMHRVYEHSSRTLTDGFRRYWHNYYCYVRVPHTRASDNNTSWEILFNQDGLPLTGTEEIKIATKVYVREFSADNDGTYTWVQYDKSSLFLNGDTSGDLDPTKFQGHYTFATLRENIITACQMYGFKVIDLYNDSCLNLVTLNEVTPVDTDGYWYINGVNTGVASSKALYAASFKVPNLELFDWKGIHPTELGYQIGYEPYIKQALCLATKKADT